MGRSTTLKNEKEIDVSAAHPELKLSRGGGGWGEGSFDFLTLLAFLPSVISSFLPKIRGGGGGRPLPLDPPLGLWLL